MKRRILISLVFLLLIETSALSTEWHVPSRDYPTIQSAINAAVNGDEVVVAPGVYTGSGNHSLDFHGRVITVRSWIDPDNPNWDTIAATIIDCWGSRYTPLRAFHFDSGESINSKVLGFTIRKGYARGQHGVDGNPGANPPVPYESIDPEDVNGIPRAEKGKDSPVSNGYGGAILCENASSPTIQYCVITNCTVTGGQGGNGANGQWGPWSYQPPDPNDPNFPDPNTAAEEVPDGQWGGHGGDGYGNGHGGAIACLGGSRPFISDCIIKDNIARGGRGGDGGNGGYATFTGDPPDYDYEGLESFGGNAGNSHGDGIGGGIYCENATNPPTIVNCTFSNNIATTGARAAGGLVGQGNAISEDDGGPATDGANGWVYSHGGIAGGAAYYHNSDANFIKCTFTANKAYEAYAFFSPFILGEDISAYTVGGALYSDTKGILNTCDFINNMGGAVYCGHTVNINNIYDPNHKCLFTGNSETANGGAVYVGSGGSADIRNCIFGGNSAKNDGGALKCESNIELKNCSFGDNTAESGYGGATDVYTHNTLLTIDVNNCSFSGNQALFGGGFSSENFTATFSDCYFVGNAAEEGGGLDLVNGDVNIDGGIIKDNIAIDGYGGGLNCSYTIADINHSTFVNNLAYGVFPGGGSGGAINFEGAGTAIEQRLFNCLLTGNFAAEYGGAVYCYNATPEVNNCTFDDDFAGGFGGAIFSNWSSLPEITNCIFQNCSSHAIHEESNGDAIVKYSLFYNNPDGDYYDSGTGLVYTGPGQVGSIPGGSNNLYGDPLFVSGDLGGYYLRQSLPQTPPDSPAIDSGLGTAVGLGLNTFTTRTDNVGDAGQVDRGYHYRDSADVETFLLTTSVIGGHGSIAPPSGTHYAGTIVTLTAMPNAGWLVKQWTGTDNDASTNLTNTVVMNADKTVTVELRQPRTLRVSVGGGQPGYYSDIQDAVLDANDGDTIVVDAGTYYGGYTATGYSYGRAVVVDRSVLITSKNPDDPACVAATIIDGYIGTNPYTNFGVMFTYNAGAGAVLNGFTIQNCGGSLLTSLDGDRNLNHPDGYDGGCAEGPAIFIEPGASPTIKNCVLRDNWIVGGNGGDGVGATDNENAGRGGWSGWSHGGAIYCAPDSSATFINCQIIDNNAIGGDGGDGGDDVFPGGEENYGGTWSIAGSPESPAYDFDPFSLAVIPIIDGHLWEVWQWDLALYYAWYYYYNYWDLARTSYFGNYRWYSGLGGGAYCDFGSSVTFIDCQISRNTALGGMSGQGGLDNFSQRPIEPLVPYEIPSFGGGVYCAFGATVRFTGCTITDNISSPPTLVDVNDPNSGLRHRLNPYLGHGGGVCAEDTATVIFNNCTFGENEASVGGGVHWANANPDINDCNFTSNSAYHGGGLFGERGPATIINCNITNNEAVSKAEAIDPNSYEEIRGSGGGVHCWATDVNIIDCNISSNRAETSGGGVYLGGENTPSLFNCLITENFAGRDGGGISADWYADVNIVNCTIADNTVAGGGYGGGLYCSYSSYVNIINSIIWNNIAIYGSQLAIATAYDYNWMPSALMVTYTDIGPRYDPNTFTVPIFDDSFDGDLPPSGPNTVLVDGQNIYDQFDAGQGQANVIVSMPEPGTVTDWDSPESVAALRAEMASRQSAVLSTLTSAEFSLRHRYENIAGFSGEITGAGLEKLLNNPLVAHIEPVRHVCLMLAQAIPLANALDARGVYDGTGAAIAIVDTGIDYTHPMLGGGGFPNSKVIGGYDTGNSDPDPMPVGEAHGTCCAGIAAGNLDVVGDYIGGVAPGAKLYALKATADNVGYFLTDDELAAWDWCITHRNDDPNNPIKVMSNSWGMSGVPFNDPGAADAYSPAHTTLVETAVAAGITVLASSGNDGFAGQGISWPSAISKVISVGAVYDTTDQVTEYSNTAEILDILAPADPIYTTDIVGPDGYAAGNYYPFFNGTSAACPFAAGAVASLQSAARAKLGRYLTPAEVKSLLVAAGNPVTDIKAAITKPRVNLANAIAGLEMAPIYVEKGCELNGWEAPDTNNYWGWDPDRWPNSHNIDEDPLFIAGYYLSQLNANQPAESNCADGGNSNATDIGLDTYTTRTDSVPDVGIVDMGYHYKPFIVPQYRLTFEAIGVTIIEPNIYDPSYNGFYDWYTTVPLKIGTYDSSNYQVWWIGTDDDSITGPDNTVTMNGDKLVTVQLVKNKYELTIDVDGGNGQLFAEWSENDTLYNIEDPCTYPVKFGTVVQLTAVPDEGYRVRRWSDTDDDASRALTNTVTMDSDRTVRVEFGPPRTLNVPGEYTSIQQAIDAAEYGDRIVIAKGTYITSQGYQISNKAVTLRSTNPDDPCCVAATIIQMESPVEGWVWHAFSFDGVGPSTVLNGLTISGSGFYFRALDGDDGDSTDPNLFSGQNGASFSGGAIICNNASPTIKNCIITDWSIVAGDGGDGVNGTADYPEGGHGGWPGRASGAGLACQLNSNPTVTNCIFRNCSVTGGNGGNGGNGNEDPPGEGGRGGGWYYSYPVDWPYGPYEFYTKYSGLGGAVFVGEQCSPTFTRCSFTNNRTEGGTCGICGQDNGNQGRDEPGIHWKIDNLGGAVYCDVNSAAVFKYCVFNNNIADTNTLPDSKSEYVSYGGAVAFEESAKPVFENCTFNDNLASIGGAMYGERAYSSIVDCDLVANTAFQGGGVYFVGGTPEIARSNFSDNDANGPAGAGGAIYCSNANALIADCSISHNDANSSGGGIYITGGNTVSVENCLIVNNSAGRDGGGISVNWYSEPIIANCTVVGNQATGSFGELGNTGFGGGLYCSYKSNSEIIDSILWDNSALNGCEIAVGTGFWADQSPSTVNVSYSDIKGGRTAVQVDSGCTLAWDVDPDDPDYPTNIDADPNFVTGPLSDYYLSQTDVNDPNQTSDSPCVDAGSDFASHLGMNRYTTRTDGEPDKGKVDMGYHYPFTLMIEPCSFCDLVYDGVINFIDFAELALHWLEEGCSDVDDWCQGADLTFDTYVDIYDLVSFVECWLVEDTSAPVPNPSEWEIEPHSTSTMPPYTISMTAKTAVDAWGWDVQYYFECITDDVNSGWQDEPNYTDTGLILDTEYGYRVKARDVQPQKPETEWNETSWSVIRYAIAGEVAEVGAAEPPELTVIEASPNSITIQATTTDPNGIAYIEYDFEETSGNPGGSDSGWQDEPNYTDTGLDPNTTYTYRVRAIDENDETTGWSVPLDVTTLPEGGELDITPPEPDPMQWDPVEDANGYDGTPRKIHLFPYGTFDYYVTMRAVTATDPSGVWYSFVCVDDSSLSSDWILEPTYTPSKAIGGQYVQSRWYVIARDGFNNMTDPSPTLAASVP